MDVGWKGRQGAPLPGDDGDEGHDTEERAWIA